MLNTMEDNKGISLTKTLANFYVLKNARDKVNRLEKNKNTKFYEEK